jgi:hypothetical protein
MSASTLLIVGCTLGAIGVVLGFCVLTIQEWSTRQKTLRWRHEMKRRKW